MSALDGEQRVTDERAMRGVDGSCGADGPRDEARDHVVLWLDEHTMRGVDGS